MLIRLLSVVAIAASAVTASESTRAPLINQQTYYASQNIALVKASRELRIHALTQLEDRTWTNAKRLNAGLPLKPPHRKPSGTLAARAGAPSQTFVRGCIEAREVGTDTLVGFFDKRYNTFGEAVLTTVREDRMVFSVIEGGGGPINLETVNGPAAKYPLFGSSEPGNAPFNQPIGPGSPSFVWFAGTGETTAASPAVSVGSTFNDATGINALSESAIWTYKPSSEVIIPQWVNANGAKPVVYIAYLHGLISLTGDKTVFEQTFGQAMWLWLVEVDILALKVSAYHYDITTSFSGSSVSRAFAGNRMCIGAKYEDRLLAAI
ncbi:hypothetical protein B0H34DRAFT_803561 [Crassisporium funariophilum]|nr:hypothetical protein B0H34DRAFT_803561 [Crassisporium funariophilum]